MKLFYHENLDILCIVDGQKIWKYLGDFCENGLLKYVVDENQWYRADAGPIDTLNGNGQELVNGWELIGEM